jgi:hypothetical protein
VITEMSKSFMVPVYNIGVWKQVITDMSKTLTVPVYIICGWLQGIKDMSTSLQRLEVAIGRLKGK